MDRSTRAPEGLLERELTTLIADYGATREDQRQATLRQSAVLSAGIAVFAAFYFLASEESFLTDRPLLALALPLAPYLIAQTYIWYEIDVVLRGYYVRALEKAIQQRVAVPSALGHGINLPSLGYLSYIVAAPRHFSTTVRVINIGGWVAVVALFGGSSVLAILALPTPIDRAYAFAIYAALALFLFLAARENLFRGARKSFHRHFELYPNVFAERLDRPMPSSMSPESRRILDYLLMPRTAELIKWNTFVTTFVITLVLAAIGGFVAMAEVPQLLLMALVYLLLFEYLIYQARYQWNDLRGAEREAHEVSRDKRKRLPPGRCAQRLSFVVMIVRIVTAFYLVDLIFRPDELRHLIPIIDAVLLIPFAIALPYEVLREIADRNAVKRRALRLLTYQLIFLLVGLGFAVRVALGVIIGSNGSFDLSTLSILFVAASLMGSAETLAIWAIAAGVAQNSKEARTRPDTAILVKYLRPLAPQAKLPIDENDRVRLSRDNFLSPWVGYALASVAAAAVFGLLLAGFSSPETADEWRLWIIFIAGWTAFAACCVFINAIWAIILTVCVAGASAAYFWVSYGLPAAVAPVAVLGLMITHLGDRCYSHYVFVVGLRPQMAAIATRLHLAISAILSFLFGPQGAENIFGRLIRKRSPALAAVGAGGRPELPSGRQSSPDSA